MPKAIWKNTVLAQAKETIVVDGFHYFSRTAVAEDHLRKSDTHTT